MIADMAVLQAMITVPSVISMCLAEKLPAHAATDQAKAVLDTIPLHWPMCLGFVDDAEAARPSHQAELQTRR
jgi:hypothetical protein